MGDLLDPELLDAIDALKGSAFKGEVWCVTWATRDPLASNTAGGRWSPDGRFEVLYTSLEPDGAMAETYYHLSRAPVVSSFHMHLNHLSVVLENVLRLNSDQLIDLGIEEPFASRLNSDRSQSIGETAFMLDYQGLIVPSARWGCDNLVIFIDQKKFDLNEHIEFIDASEVNWPAWKERSATKRSNDE